MRRQGRRRRSINMSNLAQTDWVVAYAAWAAAIAAIVYTVLTLWLSWETRQTRLAQTAPNVVVRVVHDRDRQTMLCIVIENIGRGAALDVKFDLSREIPQTAYGLAVTDAAQGSDQFRRMTKGPLVSGIPLLCPGDSRVINWGQFGGLTSAIGSLPVTVTARYRDGNGLFSRKLSTNSYLEVGSFSWTDASATATTEISRSLRKIAEAVGHLSSGFRKLRIVVQTVADERLQDEKARQEWIETNAENQGTSVG